MMAIFGRVRKVALRAALEGPKMSLVRATMSVALRHVVTAADEAYALEQAKAYANDGLMDEVPNSGPIHDWEVIRLPRRGVQGEAMA
jgi:hypothetical protein